MKMEKLIENKTKTERLNASFHSVISLKENIVLPYSVHVGVHLVQHLKNPNNVQHSKKELFAQRIGLVCLGCQFQLGIPWQILEGLCTA